jgi:hypothetical protein
MKRNAIVRETNTITGRDFYIPCYILDIIEDDIFPIKYRYKGKGYSNLIFSTTKERIEII